MMGRHTMGERKDQEMANKGSLLADLAEVEVDGIKLVVDGSQASQADY